jgi:hypothetical protein
MGGQASSIALTGLIANPENHGWASQLYYQYGKSWADKPAPL